MTAAKRVIANTGAQYLKMAIVVVVSLYSTRLVLDILGTSDFGVFSLIAGMIGMLSFLNGAMASAVQRFLSINIGAGKLHKIQVIFNSSLVLHFLLGIIIVSLLEVAGLYTLNNFLEIPADRIQVAIQLFHLVVLSTFFTVLGTPFSAALLAQENLMLDAVLSVLQSVLKLGAVLCLPFLAADKLLVYGIMITAITILIQLATAVYLLLKYKQYQVSLLTKTKKWALREMTAFSKWMTIGAGLYVAKRQGLALVLNPFFGTTINAAYGIASQVNGQISFLSQALMKAISPQIIKKEGELAREGMLELSHIASKFSFFLVCLCTIPILIELPFILKLWLTTIPDYVFLICGSFLISGMIRQITSGIYPAIQAVGKIKKYELLVNGISVITLPCAFLILYFGLSLTAVFVVYIVVETFLCITEIFLAKKAYNLKSKDYAKNVVLKAAVPVFLAFLAGLVLRFSMDVSFWRFILVVLAVDFSLLAFIWTIGLNQKEKNIFQNIFRDLKIKVMPKLV